MYDKFNSYIKQNFGNIIAMLLCFAVFLVFVFCAGKIFSTTDTNNNVDRELEQIKESASNARSEIEHAEREVKTAESANARATEAITRSQETARNIDSSIKECQQLVDDCQSINKEIGDILKDIGDSNRTGTQESKTN